MLAQAIGKTHQVRINWLDVDSGVMLYQYIARVFTLRVFDDGDITRREAIGRGSRDIDMVDGVVTRGEIPGAIGFVVFIELPIVNDVLQA
jgi:hypothetical protein